MTCLYPDLCDDGAERYRVGCRDALCRERHRVMMRLWRTADITDLRPVCAVDACSTVSFSRGLCPRCYKRWRSQGKPTMAVFVKWTSPSPPDRELVHGPDHH